MYVTCKTDIFHRVVRVRVTLRLTASQSVCLGVENLCYCLTVTVLSLGGRPLWREDGSVVCESQSAVLRQLSLCTVIYILYVLHDNTIYTWPLSVRVQYSRLCPISGSFRYNGSLVTWTVVCLTAAKFKPLVFSVTGFALSNCANVFIIMILYHLCLLPA
jgi:hypothetical protein